MSKELSFETISNVVDTWAIAKRAPAFEEKAGYLVLTRLFELQPKTKTVFGFPSNANFKDSPLLQMGALIHAKRMIIMFDTAFNLLGPDMETVHEVLQKLGKRHVKYGVKASYLPYMGMAICHALKEILGAQIWNEEVEESFNEVYEELSVTMMKAIYNDDGEAAQPTTEAPSFIGVL